MNRRDFYKRIFAADDSTLEEMDALLNEMDELNKKESKPAEQAPAEPAQAPAEPAQAPAEPAQAPAEPAQAPAEPADESSDVMADIKELEAKLAADLPDQKDVVTENARQDEAKDVLASCDRLERMLSARESTGRTAAERKAAVMRKAGAEKSIRDTAGGMEPTVSKIVKSQPATDSKKSVFPTRCKMVSARLDRVADELEKRGLKRLAFQIDRASDELDDIAEDK